MPDAGLDERDFCAIARVMDRGGESIAGNSDDGSGRLPAGLSLLFAAGTRPDADAIAAAAAIAVNPAGFAISHRPVDRPYWLELLILGLTYDLQGLAPGMSAETISLAHGYGVWLQSLEGAEAVTIRPGPHLAAGGALTPVIRAMCILACHLARLPGLIGVGWEPARTLMAPEHFRAAITAWIDHAVFPALGLTALVRTEGGGFASEGLAFFTGHELQYQPLPNESAAEAGRYALRLINDLVGSERYPEGQVPGPGGDRLLCRYAANRTILRISKLPTV